MNPTTAFVWMWLAAATDPVVAGSMLRARSSRSPTAAAFLERGDRQMLGRYASYADLGDDLDSLWPMANRPLTNTIVHC